MIHFSVIQKKLGMLYHRSLTNGCIRQICCIHRDHFLRDGSCQIVNNWSDAIVSEGQKVIQYTIVLKFDDQMVANSVKQK